jgi:chaperonin GroES
MTYTPILDHILVKRTEKASKSASGIHLPDYVTVTNPEGVVVAVGAGAWNEAGNRVPMSVAKGNTVVYGRALLAEIDQDGEKLLVMKESNVMAVSN